MQLLPVRVNPSAARMCIIALSLHFLSLISATSSISFQNATDTYHAITQQHTSLPEQEVFQLTELSLSYIDSLNLMLSSTSAMVATSPQHITSPVFPVIVPFQLNVPNAPPMDAEVALALVQFQAQDRLAFTTATTATKATIAKAAAAVAPAALPTLSTLATEISTLRHALALFVDRAYEGTYLGITLPLSEFAPIVRAIGSVFQRVLFNWQLGTARSVNFYTQRLVSSEHIYLETFFELYGYEHYNFHYGLWYGNRMSSFTWSHRSHASEASIRFACGTTSQEQPFALRGLEVLQEKSIDLSQEFDLNSTGLSFYGLGWDLEENNFKVYVMFHGLDALPEKYKQLAQATLRDVGIDLSTAEMSRHGLLSLTYLETQVGSQSVDAATGNSGSNCNGDTLAYYDPTSSSNSNKECAHHHKQQQQHRYTLHEEKVYLYPTVEEAYKHRGKHDIQPVDGASTSNVAWLLASKRGFVPQFDALITPDSEAVWRQRLGGKGEQIIDKYARIHLKLETIAYQSPEKWTIYFPAGSG